MNTEDVKLNLNSYRIYTPSLTYKTEKHPLIPHEAIVCTVFFLNYGPRLVYVLFSQCMLGLWVKVYALRNHKKKTNTKDIIQPPKLEKAPSVLSQSAGHVDSLGTWLALSLY